MMGFGRTVEKGIETAIRTVTGKTDKIDRNPLARMALVFVALLAIVVAVLLQAWRYQGPASEFLSGKADRQTSSSDRFTGNRGTIFDSSGKRLLAATVRNTTVKTDGKTWPEDVLMIASSLSEILEMPIDDIFRKIWDGIGSEVVIRDDIGPVEEAAIRRLQLPTVRLSTQESRFYPLEQIGGNLLGFVKPDDEVNGKYVGELGVEEYYEKVLAGQVREFPVGRDKDRSGYYEGAVGEGWNVDGADLVLSIDARLQIILDRELARAVRRENATGGMAVIMDPYTFQVLAMSSYPFLDPNNYKDACGKTDALDMGDNACRNKVVSFSYEPGSIAKLIGASALLESGNVRIDTLLNGGGAGGCRVGDGHVSDVHPVGIVTLRDAIKHSSNCAMADGARRVSPDLMRDIAKGYGIGEGTGIDLPNEAPGKIREDWTTVDAQVGAYGYGYRTTLMTMAGVAATIVNGGTRLAPRVVKQITLADGTVKTPDRPVPVQVISGSTAAALRDAMVGVVMEQGGTGGKARPAVYTAGGKTGTARRPGPKDAPKAYNCSFVGFAPATKPAFVMAVTILDPKEKAKTGGAAAAPVFKSVADQALPLLGVKPDNPTGAMARGPEAAAGSVRN